jgi:MFS family permease
MHADDFAALPDVKKGPAWWREPTAYQWWVLIVASLGWMFDTMDQRIFLVSRETAMTQLLGYERDDTGRLVSYRGTPVVGDAEVRNAEGAIKWYGGLATTVFMLGWATGGLVFGIMGDRWGRARTMMLTILIYSLSTGLSALSQHWGDFMLYRFLTGLGVGGEFAAGVSLVAEVMPNRARPFALGLLQALSAVGNIIGSMLSWVVMPYGWQYMFLVGALPALVVVVILRTLREPEAWQRVKAGELPAAADAQGGLGSLAAMLRHPRWRRHTIIGVLLALSGVIGLWGVGFWSFELVSEALRGRTTADVTRIRALGTSLQDVGAFIGIVVFSLLAARMGRRGAFGLGFSLALVTTVFVFVFMRTEAEVYWMLPILGFFNLSVFGGYAIYFPELYPTRLRSTGTGFCYNVARYIAAAGPYVLGNLVTLYGGWSPTLFSRHGGIDSPFRYAAVTVAMVYVIGLVVLPFAPETKGNPLPE